MVTSGTVNSSLDKFLSDMGDYSSSIESLSGSWKGASHDKLEEQATSFASRFKDSLENHFNSFAEACDLYKKYEEEKENIEKLEVRRDNEYNSWQSAKNNDNDVSAAWHHANYVRYRNEVDRKTEEQKELKKKINALLDTVTALADSRTAAKEAAAAAAKKKAEEERNKKFKTVGGNVLLNCDLDGILALFGSQLSGGTSGYGKASDACDDYARGYCLYVQTGKVAPQASVGRSGGGLTARQVSADNRKDQAQKAYDRVINEEKPCVIHINSGTYGSGQGHWVTVVGVKDGVKRDKVTVGDLIVMDPADGKLKPLDSDPEYCREDLKRCTYEPGYHIQYYD